MELPVPVEDKLQKNQQLNPELREKSHYRHVPYRYIYVDSLNKVHIIVPLSRGREIGLDNTCEAHYELQEFFGCGAKQDKLGRPRVSAVASVNQCIRDLEATSRDPIVQQQLDQLYDWQAILSIVRYDHLNGFPDPIQKAFQEPGANCATMRLKPLYLDTFLKFNHPAFVLSRNDSGLGYELHQAKFERKEKSLLNCISEMRQDPIATDSDIASLETTTNEVFEQTLKQGSYAITGPLKLFHIQNRGNEERLTIKALSSELLLVEGPYSTLEVLEIARDSSQGIDNGLSMMMWELVRTDPFRFAEIKYIPILVQFFLGVAALYYKQQTGKNLEITKLLDFDAANRQTFVREVRSAVCNSLSVENCILRLMQQLLLSKDSSFDFNDPSVQQAIGQRFRSQAFELLQGETPHWDEFIQLWPDKEGGYFYGFDDRGAGGNGNGYSLIGLHFGQFVFHHSPDLHNQYFSGICPRLATRISPYSGQHPVKLYENADDAWGAIAFVPPAPPVRSLKKFFVQLFNPSIWIAGILIALGAGLLISGISTSFPAIAALPVLQTIAVSLLPLFSLVAAIAATVFVIRAIGGFMSLARGEILPQNTWASFSKAKKFAIITGGIFAVGLLGFGIAIGITLFVLPLSNPLWLTFEPLLQLVGQFFATGLNGLGLGELANLCADGHIATAVLFITVPFMLSVMIFERCLSTTILKGSQESPPSQGQLDEVQDQRGDSYEGLGRGLQQHFGENNYGLGFGSHFQDGRDRQFGDRLYVLPSSRRQWGGVA